MFMLRSRLKWWLLTCVALLAATVFAQFGWPSVIQIADLLYVVETGSAVGAIALSLVLLATV